MTDEQRVQALIALYKQQMERFHQTQQIEWKGNFGIWTLLAGSIYIAEYKLNHAFGGPRCAVIMVLVFVWVLHFIWLLKVHKSQQVDKTLWVEYRIDALRILRGRDELHKYESQHERNWEEEAQWLVTELGITAVLCVLAGFLLLSNTPLTPCVK